MGKKLTWPMFLNALEYAVDQASMDRASSKPVRYSIERAGLPLPPIKDLVLILKDAVDGEIARDPIYQVVEAISADRLAQHCKLGVIKQMALVEAAWEHYESLFDEAGNLKNVAGFEVLSGIGGW